MPPPPVPPRKLMKEFAKALLNFAKFHVIYGTATKIINVDFQKTHPSAELLWPQICVFCGLLQVSADPPVQDEPVAESQEAQHLWLRLALIAHSHLR